MHWFFINFTEKITHNYEKNSTYLYGVNRFTDLFTT